jgi:Domain of unknown function (DUF1996)
VRRLLAVLVLVFVFVGALVVGVPAAHAATPRFQIRCGTSHVDQVDPIVAPGLRSAHLHEFFGNRTTGARSTYESMVAGRTTCSAPGDTAGYWVPTLISRSGMVVRARTILLYYRGAPGVTTVAFPPDLRMVSHDSRVGPNPSHLIIKFPACWDGLHTDSADHISHMARPTGGVCPVSHPVRVPALSMVVRYPIPSVSGYRLSSGTLSTMHADFWNTWNQPALEVLTARCLNTSATSCPRIDGLV